jgi:hypothetical protein
MLAGLRLAALAAPLVVALTAPLQCGRKPPPEQRTEDEAAEVLYMLADKFKAEGNAAARAETLRFIIARYPASRFAETAKVDLAQEAPR